MTESYTYAIQGWKIDDRNKEHEINDELYDVAESVYGKEDIYEIIKYHMKGQRFTPNKRMQFERAFLKVLDGCKRFDFYAMVREAISLSGI